MSNLNFINQILTFNEDHNTHHLQARALSKITDGVQSGYYIYSQIVELYTVKRTPYVLRDLASNEDNPTLYGFAIQDKDLIYGQVSDIEYQDYIWIDDFSSGTRIPYQYILYIKNGDVFFFKPDNNLIYPDRFKHCYALADDNGTLYRIVVINNDLYLIPENELNLSGGE